MALSTPKRNRRGFTLVELMVVLVILGVISIGAITAITGQSKVYHSEEDLVDMQMNARIAMDRICYMLRLGGVGCSDSFGLKLNSGSLVTKGDVAANPTTSMFAITNHTPGTPDQLTVVGAFKHVGRITSTPANNQIKLACREVPKIRSTAGKNYIFITPADTNSYRAISAISSTTTKTPTLTLTTAFDIDEKKELDDFLTAGVEVNVYQVQAFTARLVDTNGVRSLRIDENIDTSSTNLDVADNIQDLQFQYGLDTNNDGQVNSWVNTTTSIHQIKVIRVFILACTAKTDNEYTDTKQYTLAGVTIGPFNDHTHRLLLEASVAVRNRNL